MEILVTGGAGFIGSHLVKKLVNEGHKVTVIDNLERGNLIFLEGVISKINFFKKDLRKYSQIHKFFKNKECVIHLASKVGGIGTYVSKPYEVMSSNLSIDSNVLKAVISYEIKNYFYASSAHIYPKSLQTVKDSPKILENEAYPADPELSYGWAKLIGEKAIEAAVKEYDFLNASIARFIGIYGPNQDYNLETGSVIPVFSHRAIKYPTIPFNVWGTGEETRSYCYIDDALECINLMIEKNKDCRLVGPLNVGKEERVSISTIAKTIIDISNKNIDIEYDTSKKTLIWGQWCDCKKALAVLNWSATTSLEKGLRIVYKDIKNRI
jgi:UDP-glucose 4-epimerase